MAKDRLEKLYRTAPRDPTPYIDVQLRATKALLKFCEDHGRTAGLEDIKNSLAALEQGNVLLAIEYYQKVPLGGAGTFSDWWPEPLSQETGEYAWTVFEALVAYWSNLMKLSLKK